MNTEFSENSIIIIAVLSLMALGEAAVIWTLFRVIVRNSRLAEQGFRLAGLAELLGSRDHLRGGRLTVVKPDGLELLAEITDVTFNDAHSFEIGSRRRGARFDLPATIKVDCAWIGAKQPDGSLDRRRVSCLQPWSHYSLSDVQLYRKLTTGEFWLSFLNGQGHAVLAAGASQQQEALA